MYQSTHLDTKAVSGRSKLKETSFASDAVFSTVCVTSVDAYLGKKKFYGDKIKRATFLSCSLSQQPKK